MNKAFRTAARLAAPRLKFSGIPDKRSVSKAARWAQTRLGSGPAVARRTPLSMLVARGFGIALLVLPIGFLLGRRLLTRRK